MTINLANNNPRIEYTVAQGVVQTVFTVPFEYFEDADVSIYVDGVKKSLGADYTLSGGDGSTGVLTFVTAVPPAVQQITGAVGGSEVSIVRDVALERTTDFAASGYINRVALNTQLDTIVAQVADLDDRVSRSLHLNDSVVGPDMLLTDARKGKIISFNETTGAVETNQTIADFEIAVTAITVATAQAVISTNEAAASAASAAAALVSETNAGTSETNSASSATSAAAQVTLATTAKTAAELAETNAETAESNAATSATNAATSATTASTGASTASTKATEAATSATSASTSATAASSSETAAATSESNASTSETNAATSATSAATSATASAASATAAASSETNADADRVAAQSAATTATTKASEASTSETNAATSASTATTKASEAATSATNSATSATESEAAKTAAEAAKDAALAALDSFDDRYLGAKASDPTLDNDGNALIAGALYYNTTDDVMKVYEGSVWVAAYASLSGALLTVNNLSDVASVSSSRTNLGLGTAATTASTDYATAAQGALADTATQPADLATVATTGGYSDLSGLPTLGTAAATASTDYATAAQGTLADSAVQPNDSPSFVGLTATGAFTSLGIDDNATSTAITIDASENVGIGTASPNTKLTVSYGDNATTAERLVGRFYSYDATPLRGLEIYNGIGGNRANGLVRFNAESEGATGVLAFDTDGTEAMRISADGFVGIGDTNPSEALSVIGNIAATGTVSVADPFAIGYSAPTTTAYGVQSNSVSASPFSGMAWHDLLAFDRNYSTTYETFNGASWSASAVNKNVFAQKENQTITLASGSGTTKVRYNFTGTSWSNAEWLCIGFTFSNPTSSKTVILESSSDNTNWTTRHTSTTSSNAAMAFFPVGAYDGDNYLRLTFERNDTNDLKVSFISLLTKRSGDQGRGKEQEFPYAWDANKNITVENNLSVTGNLTLSGSVTEGVFAVSGTSPALDPANGTIQTWTLSANSTPTDSVGAGESMTLMIDDGAARTITWPTITWVNNGAAAPTLAVTGYTVVALWKVSTTLYGALVGAGA